MLEIKGTYQNGCIRLDSTPHMELPSKVIVSFPETKASNQVDTNEKPLKWANFSFDKSRRLLKDLKSSLSEEVISERRHA